MADKKAGKQYCILDAISLVKLCQLELGSRRAIEWLLNDFVIFIPQKVFDEGKNNLSVDDDEERTIFFGTISSCICKVDPEFQKSVEQHIKRLSPNTRGSIDEGEKLATALALQLSRFEKQYVVFVSDDYKANDSLEEIYALDQIGLVRNSYDLLLFLGSRHSDELPRQEIETALKQLAYLIRDKSKPAYDFQRPDELREHYLDIFTSQLTSILPED